MTPLDELQRRATFHEHRLHTTKRAATAVHGSGRIGRFNKWLAVAVTNAVGTMWCAYAFGALALVSLPAAVASHNAVVMVSWLSQTFLQLVLLSIIIVGQQVQAEASDRRAETDHETLQLLHEINVTQLALIREVRGFVGNRR